MSDSPQQSATPTGPATRALVAVRDHVLFDRFILITILVAAVVVGLETYPAVMERFGKLLHTMDVIILLIFAVEAAIKIGAEGKRPWRYFYSGWNVFDFTILLACCVPYFFADSDAHFVAVLRLVRLLRVLRLVSAIPRLQFLVSVLFRAVPSFGYVALLLGLIFYVYAAMGVFLFRGNDPVHFADLQTAALTLFRVVTLEDWTDIMYIQIFGSNVYTTGLEHYVGPLESQAFGAWAALYFVSFVVFGALVILNLFIGVIVNGIHEIHVEEEHEKMEKEAAKRGESWDAIRTLEHVERELADLKEQLKRRE